MRLILSFLASLVLISCGPTVGLYTDDLFRAAAPEIVEAWKSMPWGKSARTIELPPGSGLTTLEASLASDLPDVLLIGMGLSAAEIQELKKNHPTTKLVLLQTKAPPGFSSVGILRADAWSTLALAAVSPQGATFLFPSDVTPQEVSQVELAWTTAGGGPLKTASGYRAGILDGRPEVVFHWAGLEMDAQIRALPSTVTVHGNPGMAATPGSSGLTWAIKKRGLADFLWQLAVDPEEKAHFLPLETVLDHR